VRALEAVGLKTTLQETGPYTIFAPVDDAFVQMPQTQLHELLKVENRKTLRSLLKNHIIPGDLPTEELKKHDEIRAVTGEQLKIEARAGLWVNEGRVVTPDLKASNGVIHGIHTFLMPQMQAAAAQ
jgi:uncharacterized surface protein with fasciclin (FAS1) repeats